MSYNSIRPRIVIKAEAMTRLAMLSTIAKLNGSVQLTEFPKCGGSWYAQMLSSTTGLDHARNRFPRPIPTIFHGHFLKQHTNKLIVLWRDPAQIMVSWYKHCLIHGGYANIDFVNRNQNALGSRTFSNITENMADFIEYAFTELNTPKFNWNDFFDRWFEHKNCTHSYYEVMRLNPEMELSRLLASLGFSGNLKVQKDAIEQFSITQQKQRISQNSFINAGHTEIDHAIWIPENLNTLHKFTGDRRNHLLNRMNT